MSIHRWIYALLLMLLLMLFLTACASLPIVGVEGPIMVILDTPSETTRVCRELIAKFAPPGQYWRGCVTVGGGKAIVRCPFDDAQCLAHEVRHIIEGNFHQ